MGSCISCHHHADMHLPGPFPLLPITHIVAHRTDNPKHFLFEYRMNLGPIAIGQGVVLYDRAEDCFNPDPSLRPLMEGRLEAIIDCTPHWLTF